VKKIFLLASLFFLSGISGYAEKILLFDFEDNRKMGGSWDCTETIVPNPSTDAINSSNKCLETTFTQTWGKAVSFQNVDYAKYAVSFLVYTDSPGDIWMTAYDGNQNFDLSQSVFRGNRWTRLYFDFSEITSASNSIQIWTKSTNTILLDSIQLVSLSEVPLSNNCSKEMDVPYVYGTFAIGGGGFISGIITSPAREGLKFVRTDVGGAYKWNEDECAWKPLTNFISEENNGLLSIEALAVDPSNPDNIYMLAGSEYLSSQKTAILLSKDGGDSFTTIDISHLIYAHGNGNGRGNGERIAVDPVNSDIVYCGGRLGKPLIKSTDGGYTWNEVTSFPNVFTSSAAWPFWGSDMVPTTPNKNGVSAIVLDTNLSDAQKTLRMYVGVSRTGSNNVYMSEDGGDSWNPVAGLPVTGMPLRMKLDGYGRLVIAYSDKEGPNNCGSIGAIYRYDPVSKAVENISPPGNYSIGDVSCSQDPDNLDRMVCTTICTWVDQDWETGNGSVHGDIIFTSEDGGRTWRSLQNKMKFDANGCTWIPDHAIHWSCSIEMDPYDTGKVSVSSGNGLFTTNNIWCENPTFFFDVNGIEETVALDLVSVPGGNVYSVIGDYTGFTHSDIHTYAPIYKPESGSTSGIAYAAQNPDIMARVSKENIYYSENAGISWSTIRTSEVTDGDERKIAISADGKVLIFIGKHGCAYSTDKGRTWITSTGINAPTYVIADPENPNYIYAAGENIMYVSSNKGLSFTSTSLTNGGFSRICVVPGHEGVIYAPRGSNGLAVSTDYGATFSPVPYVTTCDAVGTGIGMIPDSYSLYIWGKANGCEKGIYRSVDKGNTWERINNDKNQFGGPGNGKFIVGDMNKFGQFYMSTVGLGIVYGQQLSAATSPEWKCNTDNSTCGNDPVSINEAQPENTIQCYPNPFKKTFTLESTGEYTVVNSAGQLVEAGISNGKKLLGTSWKIGTYFVTIDNKTIKVVKY
jgi:photosystem II stability/assembly factor-like uncharacterized protein